MKAILFGTILQLLKALVDAQVVNYIVDLVKDAMSYDLPGEEKKKKVQENLGKIMGSVGNAVAATAPHLLNLLIEIAVAYVKAKAV